MQSLVNRFLKYVTYDTQSAHDVEEYPSTQKQLAFAAALADECRAIGLSDVQSDCYVTATLPANTDKPVKTIGFIAHMDTSPDCSGTNVTPRVTENYDGGDIVLKNNIVLSPKEFPHMSRYVGQTIISADGTTLLGADDKAGVAEILTAMEYLIAHPEIKHGKIRIAFTPDEEVGNGVKEFDVEGFGCDFAYTIDGGELGELEMENFNAARAKIDIIGKSVHPGRAKGIMVNALLIASQLTAEFPDNETPATTEKREGFYHLTMISGSVENAHVEYIIRDHDMNSFNKRKEYVKTVVDKLNGIYDGRIKLNLFDQYYNMVEKLRGNMEVVELAQTAMQNEGIEPLLIPIRGGTDGARLSFMGLPCPNIFTGGHNYHGPYEYIPVGSMEKAVKVIINIAQLNAE